jgi:hypothetical protein
VEASERRASANCGHRQTASAGILVHARSCPPLLCAPFKCRLPAESATRSQWPATMHSERRANIVVKHTPGTERCTEN